MHDIDRISGVETTRELPAIVTNGWAAAEALSLILVAIVFLPNGSYRSGGSVVHINALTAAFGDYGSLEFGLVVVVALLTILQRVRHWRKPRRSAWGFIVVYAGVLGELLPDSWSRNTISVLKGARYQSVDVKLQYGFWLNLALVAGILIISSVVLWREPRPARDVAHRRTNTSSNVAS